MSVVCTIVIKYKLALYEYIKDTVEKQPLPLQFKTLLLMELWCERYYEESICS